MAQFSAGVRACTTARSREGLALAASMARQHYPRPPNWRIRSRQGPLGFTCRARHQLALVHDQRQAVVGAARDLGGAERRLVAPRPVDVDRRRRPAGARVAGAQLAVLRGAGQMCRLGSRTMASTNPTTAWPPPLAQRRACLNKSPCCCQSRGARRRRSQPCSGACRQRLPSP